MGPDVMQQTIPPPPPGFTIISGGGSPPPAPRTAARPAAPRPAAPRYDGPLPTDPQAVFPALVAQESGGRAGVLGPRTRYGRAEGRTQMLPDTAREMAERLNIPWQPEMMRGTTPEAAAYQDRLGLEYLRQGYEQTGNMRDALRYYHGGPDRSLWGPKTQAYAEEVLGRVGSGGAPMQDAAVPPPPPGFEIVASPLDDLNIHRPESVDLAAAAAVGDRPSAYTGPGSSQDNPFVLVEPANQEEDFAQRRAAANLSKGMWVRQPDGTVAQLTGDAYVDENSANDQGLGGVNLREENLADRGRAFAMAAAEQIPFLDEAAVGAAGLLSGRGYSDVRDSYRAVQAIDNQVNRDERIAGGLTGAAASLALPGVKGGGNFIARGASGLDRASRAALVGAPTGALFGAGAAEGGLTERGQAGAVGGLLGYGVGAVGQRTMDGLLSGAQRAVASPQRLLSERGVDLTPGQMAGGALQRVEEGLQSVPVLGDSIKSARNRNMGTFDRAAINEALAPINATVRTGGREAIRDADAALSREYDRILDPLTVAPDGQFQADVAAALAPSNLSASARERLSDVTADILGRFSQPISGRDFKQIDSELASLVRSAENGDAMSRPLVQPLRQIRDALNGTLERLDARAYADKRAVDAAYANFDRVRRAATNPATARNDGLFSPGNLNSVLARTEGRAYAKGEARLQDVTDAGVTVLGDKVPDSGTPLRSLLQVGAPAAGGLTMAGQGAPVAIAAVVAGLGALGYGQLGQKLANAVYRATGPGDAQRVLAELSRAASRTPALLPLYQQALQALEPGAPPAQRGLLSPEPNTRQGLLSAPPQP